MRRFIVRLFIFSVGLLLIIASLITLYRYFANFHLEKPASMLVLGHSHSECAYNDALIPGLVNRSQSGDTHFYNYFKSSCLISQNPSIETVFIEFTNNQLHEEMNDWIWGEEHLNYKFPKYGQGMDLKSLEMLWQHNPKGLINSSKLLLREALLNLLQGYPPEKTIGGYIALHRHKTDSLLQAQNFSTANSTYAHSFSHTNMLYLRKTVDLLQQKNKKVVLMRSPLHARYHGFANETKFQDLLHHQFSDVEFIDFSKFPLDDSEFGDLEHLNAEGADRYSQWFNKLLTKGLLRKKDKQSFVDAEIQTLHEMMKR